jgi:hypothetical protein
MVWKILGKENLLRPPRIETRIVQPVDLSLHFILKFFVLNYTTLCKSREPRNGDRVHYPNLDVRQVRSVAACVRTVRLQTGTSRTRSRISTGYGKDLAELADGPTLYLSWQGCDICCVSPPKPLSLPVCRPKISPAKNYQIATDSKSRLMFIASAHVIKTTRQRAAATRQSVHKLIKKSNRTWIISRSVHIRSESARSAFYVRLTKQHGTQNVGWNRGSGTFLPRH